MHKTFNRTVISVCSGYAWTSCHLWLCGRGSKTHRTARANFCTALSRHLGRNLQSAAVQENQKMGRVERNKLGRSCNQCMQRRARDVDIGMGWGIDCGGFCNRPPHLTANSSGRGRGEGGCMAKSAAAAPSRDAGHAHASTYCFLLLCRSFSTAFGNSQSGDSRKFVRAFDNLEDQF